MLIPVPDAILNNPDVDSININGLEDGLSIANALENADGSFTISGKNESFVVGTNNDYTGELTLSVSGYDSTGTRIEETTEEVNLSVSDSNIGVENDAYTIDNSFIEEVPVADVFAVE
ncbi:MAG TPA: hypothetical protein EYH12_00905 [Psychromonas hadalis]|nr:hypothetical protein [Psychromonas hadalis]